MYLAHFGFKKHPFAIISDPAFYYPFSSHEEGRRMLSYSLSNQDLITTVTGDIGTGKTALIEQHCLNQSSHHCCVINNPNCTAEQLIEIILNQLPIKNNDPKNNIITLEKHLRHYHTNIKPVALLIDEAQAMPPEILESFRLLTNLKEGNAPLIKIVLFGQPELNHLLQDPRLSQVRQRIGHSHHIKPLSPEETVKYINHRIQQAGDDPIISWEPKAYQTIYAISQGIPRIINMTADKALLLAKFENTHAITHKHIQKAASYTEFSDLKKNYSAYITPIASALLISTLVIGSRYVHF